MGLVPGGKISKPEQEVAKHLDHFSRLAEGMAEQHNWSFLAQYKILKVTYIGNHSESLKGP